MIFNLYFLFSLATKTLEFVVMAADTELIEIFPHPLLLPDDNKVEILSVCCIIYSTAN